VSSRTNVAENELFAIERESIYGLSSNSSIGDIRTFSNNHIFDRGSRIVHSQ
jgi:hypothetical protein